MACSLLNINYTTRHAIFSIDSETDINNLPKINLSGKGALNTIGNVSQGSKAIGTNGTNYILTGNNKWVKYSSSSSGGGGSSEEWATTDDIDKMFE